MAPATQPNKANEGVWNKKFLYSILPLQLRSLPTDPSCDTFPRVAEAENNHLLKNERIKLLEGVGILHQKPPIHNAGSTQPEY